MQLSPFEDLPKMMSEALVPVIPMAEAPQGNFVSRGLVLAQKGRSHCVPSGLDTQRGQ